MDLSTHGAWLRTSKPLEDGARLSVELSLPSGEQLSLDAEVMWSRGKGRNAGMALEWLGLADGDRRRIDAALTGLPERVGQPSRFAFADAV